MSAAITRSIRIAPSTRVLARRGYVVKAPSEKAANVASTTSSSSSGSNVAVIAGTLAIGGALYYYFSDKENAAKAKRELHHIEDKAEDAYASAKSKLAGARDSAEHSVDKLKVDTRTWAEKAHDEVTSQKNLAGSKADPALGQALAKGQEVAADAKGWFSGGSSSKVDQVESDARAELEKAKQKGQDLKENVEATGKSWLSWGGSKVDDAKADAEAKARELKSEGRTLTSRVSAEVEREKDLAARKVSEAADFASKKTEETKDAASSWWSWGSSKTAEVADSTKSAAADAKSSVDSKAAGARDSVYGAGESAKNAVASAKDGVVNAGQSAKQSIDGAASSGRQYLKDGLLAVEEATEHGAQRAQHETKKL